MPCFRQLCDDPTVDIDKVSCSVPWFRQSKKREYLPWHLLKLKPDLDRDDLCVRCNPCAVCENCRCNVDGEPVCMVCLRENEVPTLPASAQRRYGILQIPLDE